MNLLLMRLLGTTPWSLPSSILMEGEGVGTDTGDGGKGKKPNGVTATDDDDDDDEHLELEEPGDLKDRLKGYEKYTKRLRTENAKRRESLKAANAKIAELESKNKTDTDAIRTASKSELDAAVDAERKKGSDRLIRMEVKLALQAEGCKEVDDALKIADLSGIKMTEAGDVDAETVKTTVKGLKESKAYLFGTASTSSTSTAKEPEKKDDDKPKSAKDMTAEEYAAARGKFVGSSAFSRRRRSA